MKVQIRQYSIKRIFDVIISIIGLIITAPIFILIAIWIKNDSTGNVFFRGERVGLYGETFRVFKFRSMIFMADKSVVSSTSTSDSRITRSGHFIRKWKLDELAQLFNVIKGDMSLVGPRPEVQEFVDLYTEDEKHILSLRPGITDWASIWNSDEGGILEGAIDTDAAYLEVIRPTKIELQLHYVKNRTLIKDLKILLYTVYRVINSSFIPSEISSYPRFNELRSRALKVIAQQKQG